MLGFAVEIAAQAGIKYPADRVSGYPYVLTCDFMVITYNGMKARTVKMSCELSKPRVLEKLEIERRYWLTKGIDWKIVTENEIPYQKAKNIEWLYSAMDFVPDNITKNAGQAALAAMTRMLSTTTASVIDVVQDIESEFMLEPGVGLQLFKHLVLNKVIEIDLSGKLNLSKGVSVAI